MAKIGETDSRWIVAERTDGKNVGNWHWSEKDLLPFFKQALPSEVEETNLESDNAKATVTKVDRIDGDFNAMNRKGKTIFVWDLTLAIKWKGTVGEKEFTGSAEVTEIYNDEDGPYRVSVKVEKDSSEATPVRELIRKNLTTVLKPSIDKVLARAKEQISVQAPVEVKRVLAEDKPVVLKQATTTSGTSTSASGATAQSNTKRSTATMTIEQVVVFDIPPPPLFETFTDERRVSAFTQGPAQIIPKAGGAFSMFGGAVSGEVISIETNKQIVQKWRFASWPENHYSTVTLSFEEQVGKTQITLKQTGVPSNDYDRTKSGWEQFFWLRIRGLFGWSYKLR
eukprot:TRINITY_DN11987_c0_g1_i1.p1 TRINITY_DN11987_c0_g1~~TRINITY_DN11987_c0_g1_i1.p1  ORF type:complete len:339 (-),score=80.68 TRINITY_DN11987_c0_g1_i1:66-1082(-)